MELLDVVDENDKVIDVLDRNQIHEKGLLHREVIVFIINDKGEVLIQKRSANKKSDPNKWGLCAGHVDSGEKPFDSALRELYEEVGLKVEDKEMVFINKELVTKKNNSHFNYMYYVKSDLNANEFIIQKEELSEVKWIHISKLIECLKNKDNSFCINTDKIDELELLRKIIYSEIVTDRLILRKAKLEDLDEIYNNVWKHWNLAKYMLWEVTKNLDDAKIRMNRTMEYQKHNYAYFVTLKDTGEVIGFAGFKKIDDKVYEDAGLCICEKYQGMGYAKEIIKKILDIVFNELDGNRFIYGCFSENEKSKNVCLKLGFKYLKSEVKIRGYDNYKYVSESYYFDK